MADDEDFDEEEIQEALRVREEALRGRDELDERSVGLEKEKQLLSVQITEAQREVAQLRARLRTAEEAAEAREKAYEERYAALEANKKELDQVCDEKAEKLIKSNALSRELDMSYAKLKGTHAEVLEENERARQVLLMERSVAHYKERKEKECKEWDERLQKAQLECETQMSSLMKTWEAQNRQYAQEMRELQAEYDELLSKYEHKRSVAERELEYQVLLKQKAVEEAESETARKLSALAVELQQRMLALRTQILMSQKQTRDNAEATRRALHAQLEEIQRAYKLQVDREKREADELVKFEREKVREKQEDTAAWEKRVRRLEASYKGHAAKTAVLVHSLELGTQNEIARLHQAAFCAT